MLGAVNSVMGDFTSLIPILWKLNACYSRDSAPGTRQLKKKFCIY